MVFEGARSKILADAVDDNGEVIPFNECFVSHLMAAIKQEMEGQPKGHIAWRSAATAWRWTRRFRCRSWASSLAACCSKDGDEGLVFVSLYVMIDPPRPGVPEAEVPERRHQGGDGDG